MGQSLESLALGSLGHLVSWWFGLISNSKGGRTCARFPNPRRGCEMKVLDFWTSYSRLILKLLPARHAVRPRAGLFILGRADAP